MVNRINVFLKAADGEEMWFPSQRAARQYVGCNWVTLKRAAVSGKPVGRKEKFTVRFEVEPYKQGLDRQVVGFHLPTNVYIGLRIVAERKKTTPSDLMRTTLFEAYPELYLWQLGADSKYGQKNIPYEPIGTKKTPWNTPLPKTLDPYKSHNPRKKK